MSVMWYALLELLSECCGVMILLVYSDISQQEWSDLSVDDDIASMKETMKSLLQLNTSDGDFISIGFCLAV